jgi:acetylornithine/succinyldiaminopimelate/putrescine aminotransferase
MLEHLHWSAPRWAAAPPAWPSDTDGFVDARRCTVQLANGFLYLDAIADRATALLGHDQPPELASDLVAVRALLDELAPGLRCAAVVQSFDAAADLAARLGSAIAGSARKVVHTDASAGEAIPDAAILIANERETAGRTGSWLVSSTWERAPDIVVAGETLSAGRPFGAVLVSLPMADGVARLQRQDLHPAADAETLDRVAGVVGAVTAQRLNADGLRLMPYLRQRLEAVQATCSGIASLAFSPFSAAIKFAAPFTAVQIKKKLCERGVLVGLDRDRVIVAPALAMRPAEIDVIAGALRGALCDTPTWRPPVCCAACAAIAFE